MTDSPSQPSMAERLRTLAQYLPEQRSAFTEAADRIEELEKALREISDLYVNAPGWAAPAPSHQREYKMHQIARTALPHVRDLARGP